MNKNMLLGIVGVVIVVAAGWFFLGRNNTEQNRDQIQVSDDSSAEEVSSVSSGIEQKSLRDLLSLNAAQQCTFTDGANTGTTYVSNGKIRSDFTTTVDGKSMSAHMILQDNTSYFWTDESTTGFKTVLNETVQSSEAAPSDGAMESLDVDKKGDYDCKVWVVNSSVYALPSNVTFTDLSQLMQGLQLPK